jgi:hypothetical protein
MSNRRSTWQIRKLEAGLAIFCPLTLSLRDANSLDAGTHYINQFYSPTAFLAMKRERNERPAEAAT